MDPSISLCGSVKYTFNSTFCTACKCLMKVCYAIILSQNVGKLSEKGWRTRMWRLFAWIPRNTASSAPPNDTKLLTINWWVSEVFRLCSGHNNDSSAIRMPFDCDSTSIRTLYELRSFYVTDYSLWDAAQQTKQAVRVAKQYASAPASWQYLRIYSPGGTCFGMLAI